MNEDTRFILERMDKLREEFKEDLEKALVPVNKTLSAHAKKHQRLDKIENRVIGGALIVSALVTWLSKHNPFG